MNSFSVPSEADQAHDARSGDSSSRRAAGAEDAGQPEHIAKRWLARGFGFATGFSVSLPLITFGSAYLKMDFQGALGVSGLVGLIALCIMAVTSQIYDEMEAATEREADEREHAATCMRALRSLEQEHNDLQEIYAEVYAAYIEQRGAVSLLAKRTRGDAAADLPSGVNGSAAVVHLKPKGAGA